jgi:hypothetical protein
MALPATLGPNFPTSPFSLGLTTVAAAGTAVQLIHNFIDPVSPSPPLTPLANRTVKWLQIRALDTNGGMIYVVVQNGLPPWPNPAGGTLTGADTVNYLNVVQLLSAGETWNAPAYMMNAIRLGQFWVDAAVNGDKAIASLYEA